MFSSVEPFFKEGGRWLKKFQQEAEILEIFSIEVAIKDKSIFASKIYRPFNSPKSRFHHADTVCDGTVKKTSSC